MARLSPSQQAVRRRIEGAIRLAAPFLDVVLAVGERISRIAEPTDHDYYPIRSGGTQRLPGEAEDDRDSRGSASPGGSPS